MEIITVKLDKTSIHNNVAKEKIRKEYQRLWPVSEKLSKTSTEIAYTLKAYSFPCSVVTEAKLESFGEAAHIFSRRLGMAKPQDCKWFWFRITNEIGENKYFKSCVKKSGALQTDAISIDEIEKIKADK